MRSGLWLIVGDDEDAKTHWKKGVGCVARDGFLVEEEVDKGDHGGEEDASDLVESYGGVGQGEVLENDVKAHGCCEREHWAEAHRCRDEEGDEGAREDVEG